MEICPQDKRVSLEIRFDDDGKVSLARCCFLYAFSHLTLEEYGKIDDIIDYAENQKINYAKSSNICIAECYLEPKIKQVDVGISHACNLRCLNCFFSEHKDTPEMKKAYFDTLYKIKGHQLDTIMMNNGGEVFVYYKEIVEYLKSLTPNDTRQVTFVTNLLLLNEDRIKELKKISEETGVTYFFLPSVDGIKKESYEAVRIGGSFEKITENLKLLSNIFGPQQAVILYTIKKPNIDETSKVESYFKNNFGFRTTISFDVYDKECENKYNSMFRKNTEVKEVKEYSFKTDKKPLLTIITPKKLSKKDIKILSKYDFIEVHSYSGASFKKNTDNIKYFKKLSDIHASSFSLVKTKYVLYLDNLSEISIPQPEIFYYFLNKTSANILYLKNKNDKVVQNDKVFYIPIFNVDVLEQYLLKFNNKYNFLINNALINNEFVMSNSNLNKIEVPTKVVNLKIDVKSIAKFLRKSN